MAVEEQEQQHKEGCEGEEEGDGEEEVEEDGGLGVMDESAILNEYANNPYVALFPCSKYLFYQSVSLCAPPFQVFSY